ncbi:hypothetical protein Tco_0831140 [Tanacetum coccineum]
MRNGGHERGGRWSEKEVGNGEGSRERQELAISITIVKNSGYVGGRKGKKRGRGGWRESGKRPEKKEERKEEERAVKEEERKKKRKQRDRATLFLVFSQRLRPREAPQRPAVARPAQRHLAPGGAPTALNYLVGSTNIDRVPYKRTYASRTPQRQRFVDSDETGQDEPQASPLR